MDQKSFSNLELPNSEFAKDIARALLQISAVELRTSKPFFKWTSGWNSPIYTDNRLGLGYVITRDLIGKVFSEYCIKNHILQNADAVAGILTAGTLYGVLFASSHKLPFAAIRPKPKEHGKETQIECMLPQEIKGKKFIVYEDMFSTSTSSAKGVQVIRDAGGEVIAVVSVFTYGFDKVRTIFSAEPGSDNILTEPCVFGSLTSYNVLIDVAIEEGFIDHKDKELLNTFTKSPHTFGV